MNKIKTNRIPIFKMLSKSCFVFSLDSSRVVVSFPFMKDEWTTATCWYGESFLQMQVQMAIDCSLHGVFKHSILFKTQEMRDNTVSASFMMSGRCVTFGPHYKFREIPNKWLRRVFFWTISFANLLAQIQILKSYRLHKVLQHSLKENN